MGGQYRRIFGSRLAVLACPTVGPIQKPRTEYSPVLPDLRSARIYLLYDLALASSITGLTVVRYGNGGIKAMSNHSMEEGYSFVG